MAKRKLSLKQLEDLLGYQVDGNVGLGHRVYSDLTPVPVGIYDLTERELQQKRRNERAKRKQTYVHKSKFTGNIQETLVVDSTIVNVQRSNLVGLYKFFADVTYDFGVHIAFLLTEAETPELLGAARGRYAATNAKTHPEGTIAAAQLVASQQCNSFLRLPRELRNQIYYLAAESREVSYRQRDPEFLHGVGDPSGLHFPFDVDQTLLQLNRQTRQEALPIAYRRKLFYLVDVEDAVRFLLAIGRVGRENVESLDLLWESAIDIDNCWREFPTSTTNHLTLPARNVPDCIQLLKQCVNLKSLILRFNSLVMDDVPDTTLISDPSLISLCSIKRIQRVEIRNIGGGKIPDRPVTRWLKSHIST